MSSSLGEFEQLVLLALLRLDGRGYGIAVHREIRKQTGRLITLGSVYKALLRLEQKGMIVSKMGEPTAERGGRRKKYYRLLPKGHRTLSSSLRAIRLMAGDLFPLPEA